MCLVDLHRSRLLGSLVLELVLLGGVPEHCIVDGGDGEVLCDSSTRYVSGARPSFQLT